MATDKSIINDILDIGAADLGITLYSQTETLHDVFNKFFRFGYLDVYNGLGSTREYVFFTRPDLHLMEGGALNPELANIPYFIDLYTNYKSIIYQLQKSCGTDQKSPFINLFTNTATGGVDLPSIDATDTENSQTSYGDSITYRSTSIQSDNGHEFSMEFDDDKYLLAYRTLKTWDEYVRYKDKGLVTPPSQDYILNRILHDQVCAYKIIVDEDGESILYYAKCWGVYPKRTPRDVFSNMPTDGKLGISTTFHAQWVEDLDPMIMSDFRELTKPYVAGLSRVPMYDLENMCASTKQAKCPTVIFDPEGGEHGQYKLIWMA